MLLVRTRSLRGRPRIDEAQALRHTAHVALNSDLYSVVNDRADDAGISVSQVIRDVLTYAFGDELDVLENERELDSEE